MCRVGSEDRPASIAPEDHVEFRLVDTSDPEENPHLEFALADAEKAQADMRVARPELRGHGRLWDAAGKLSAST